MAETWEYSSTLNDGLNGERGEDVVSASSAPALTVSDNTTITDTVSVASNLLIDHVEVDLNLTHTWIGDLVVTLTSPEGTTSVLVNRPGVTNSDPFGTSQNNIDFKLTSTGYFRSWISLFRRYDDRGRSARCVPANSYWKRAGSW